MIRQMHLPRLSLILCLTILSACVSFPDAPPQNYAPQIMVDRLAVGDGAMLGLTVWSAAEPKAVVVAVHGMNDYANTFALAGEWWAREAGITTIAYDQRGFGRSPDFGRWPGEEILKADLRSVIAATRRDYPDIPLFVLGHSMGAAVIMVADADDALDADGLILAAPGVWGGKDMPLLYRLGLNIMASLAPGKSLTGERAARQASDNIPILRAMYEDELVIKNTRLDAILGVVRIMGAGGKSAGALKGDTFFLIGEKDEIIPIKAMETAAKAAGDRARATHYQDGWHLLFRDLEAERVWRDIAAWIADHETVGVTGAKIAANPGGLPGSAALLDASAEEGSRR